jgi:hypothetical protein
MYGHAVSTQNAYGGHTDASGYNPWTGTSFATSQGHNQYSSWGSTVVTNGNNWAEAQHGSNAYGSAGSFQTSKGSAGAGFSGANGNSGFVAKDANNNNVYAGADGNVYKKDASGNWSKWDNGNWTPVDPSTGAAQTKNQNLGNSKQSPGSTTTPRTAPSGANSGRPDSAEKGQRAGGSTIPATAPSSSDTMGQLQNDAGSHARGDQAEQNRSRGNGSGATCGYGGGSRRHP